MVNADREILVLNKRLDPTSRRNVYLPTKITGVSVYNKRQSSSDGGFHSESQSYKVRIPLDARVEGGKSYVPEEIFDQMETEAAALHWTLHNEDMIVLGRVGESVCGELPEGALSLQQVEELTGTRNVIHVVEYADNTVRGSQAVRHWRIGGA